ncbi:hypothetical protein T265_07185 [Opisthorchis viverrini]|uniref:Uncharacterized protein n=1 Tax=Opisthorchis viverrini TaxID=6198 RepID=A0A074ZPQ7_OPIVI|nr:hypothetical protein T265_07185 [Opisthorchis viverrini]KER25305.1 hypothetical protein T265_07185 [Opisthorchis viverrini]
MQPSIRQTDETTGSVTGPGVYNLYEELMLKITRWTKTKLCDPKVLGSNPTSVSRLLLFGPEQPGSTVALVLLRMLW